MMTSNRSRRASAWGVLCALLLVAHASAGPAKPRRVTVSDAGGLGRIEVKGDIAAVLRRDEGIVTLLDLKEPGGPVALGSYSDDADRSLDGDVAFSKDGSHLFYARQTEQFSRDGLHVLDLSDLSSPALTSYHPMGGAYRVETYHDGTDEWVFVLDATHGLVVFRFEPLTGQVVPVAIDALPALKVGGPASAGLFIEKDAALGVPLMYVTTGQTGLQVYDISNPISPDLVGAWDKVGLAEVEVSADRKGRTVYAATEYWFDDSLAPEVVVLDATDLSSISEKDRFSAGGVVPDPNDSQRIQGMVLDRGRLLVAHSTLGLVAFTASGKIDGTLRLAKGAHAGPKAALLGEPYAYDIELWKNLVLISDAASGDLTVATQSSI